MTLTPVTLGLKFGIRLKDLKAEDVVEATCPVCDRVSKIAPYQLYERYRPNERLVLIEKDMRCRGCGFIGPQMWQVLRASRAELASDQENT